MPWEGLAASSVMAGRVLAHDWSVTSLGSPETWPQSLRTVLTLCLDSAIPAFLWWGPERQQFYNDAARSLLAVPSASLSAPARETWGQDWPPIESLVDHVMRTGEAVRRHDLPLSVRRDGPGTEAAWFTFACTPVRDETGAVAGVFCHAMDSTAHVRATTLLRQSEASLAVELDDTQQLQRISSRYITNGVNIDALYTEILDVARALMRADFASLQHLVPERQALMLLAYQGFTPAAARHWEWVRADDTTACGIAMARVEAITVPDVELWELVAGTTDLEHFRACGIRAILSTPLIARDGRLVGMLSTHWRHVHQPSARELRLLEVVARQAADLIERRCASDALRANQGLLRAAEERQAFLLKLSDAIRPLNDAVAIQETATRLLGEHLGVTRVVYAEFVTDGDREFVVVQREHRTADVISLIGRHPAERFATDIAAVRGGRLVAVADAELENTSDERKAAWRAIGVRARLGIPLVKAGTLRAVFGLHDVNPHPWTAAEIALVSEVAERTWDAVERGRAESALRESEEKYRTLFDTIDEGLSVIDLIFDGAGAVVDYRVVSVNAAFAQHPGLVGVVGKRGRDLEPAVEPYWLEIYGDVVRTGIARRFENYHAATGRWYLVYASRLGGDDSRRLTVVFTDITVRKQTEAALRESEQRQTFLLQLSDALRPLADATAIEREACRILGDYLDADHTYYSEIDVDNDRACVRHDHVRNGAVPLVAEYRLSMFSGVVPPNHRGVTVVIDDARESPLIPAGDRATAAAAHVAWIASPVVKDGRLVGVLCVAMRSARTWVEHERELVVETAERVWLAIERARAEAARRDSEERLRRLNEELEQRVRARTAEINALFKRLVHAQEDERRRIARDVHDQLGQQITALRMQLELVRDSRSDGGQAKLLARAERLATELDESVDFLTWQLRPAALDQLGLSAALQHMVRGWSERFGINAEYDVFGLDGARFAPDAEANLYRLAQEALHNIVKHARPEHVGVVLERRDGRLLLTVEDDGIGFEVPNVEASERAASQNDGTRSMGLVNMRERAALVGGDLVIDSAPGRGTTVVVRVPLERLQ